MRYFICTGFLLAGFIFAGCNRSDSNTVSKYLTPGSYIRYAERFTVEKKGKTTLLTVIDPWQGAAGVRQQWILVHSRADIPAGSDTNRVIITPVRKIVAMSTTFLSMISALRESDKVAGISGTALLYDEALRKKVEKGEIQDVGYDDNLNKELVIKIKPDLIMVYGVGGESSAYAGKLAELGVKVVFNADYLENDPVGKAEWIKFFGALFEKEHSADSVFSAIVSEYDSVKKAVIEKTNERPAVMLGLPWKDTWYISPGNSYISRLIADAGGNYIWKDTRSETSLPYGIESVWTKAANAEYWLNISTVSESSEILAIDPRLAELPPFKNGNMYNNNNRVAPNGGIDYWESGSVKPQVILKDIASILHPGLFPGYSPFYFKKVKK
jgi:iron complex transport system substrate-binding protein